MIRFALLALFLFQFTSARALEFETPWRALQQLLGPGQVIARRADLGSRKFVDYYFVRDHSGRPVRVVFFQKKTYAPHCAHTWAIALDARTAKVSAVHLLEASCPDAFPMRGASFLDQYRGKGPADLARLDQSIRVIAQATGSCKLTTQAVRETITEYSVIAGLRGLTR